MRRKIVLLLLAMSAYATGTYSSQKSSLKATRRPPLIESRQIKFNYDAIKDIPYAQLTDDQKTFLKSELIKKLSVDPHFIQMQKHMTSIVDADMDRIRPKTPPPAYKKNSTYEQQVAYQKALGIKDPVAYVRDLNGLLAEAKYVAKIFPEYHKMDPTDRADVGKQASKIARQKQ